MTIQQLDGRIYGHAKNKDRNRTSAGMAREGGLPKKSVETYMTKQLGPPNGDDFEDLYRPGENV